MTNMENFNTMEMWEKEKCDILDNIKVENKYKYIDLNELGDIRQTYIIMYEENGIRYIFNRSVKWWGLIDLKRLHNLINILGKDAILKFLDRFDKMKDDIRDLSQTFILDTTIFTILEVHTEWQNYRRCDQVEIEKRKSELCDKYDAIKRTTGDIDIRIDQNISNIIKKEFKSWILDIYNEITHYSRLLKEEFVHTILGASIESIKKERSDMLIMKMKEQEELKELEQQIKENKTKLARQNYIIDKFYKQYDFTPQENEYIDGKINTI